MGEGRGRVSNRLRELVSRECGEHRMGEGRGRVSNRLRELVSREYASRTKHAHSVIAFQTAYAN